MTETNRPGDPPPRAAPLIRPSDIGGVQHAVDGALGQADQALRTYDSYLSRIGNSTDLIHQVLTPQIVGRGFEVGAMREHAHPVNPEAMHVLRDGRLIVADPRRAGSTEEGGETPHAAHGRPMHAGEIAGRLATAVQGARAGLVSTQELSLFEKIFLAHFEGGLPVTAKMLEKGEFKFLPKTEKGWAEFFQKFAAFALTKTAKAGDVQALVFRGLIGPDGTLTKEGRALLAQSKGILVSDLKFENGKTDKFARLGIANEQMLQTLSNMAPGETMSPAVFAELLKVMGGGELSYLSLSHKVVNPDMAKTNPSAVTEAYQSPEKMKDAAIREGVRNVTPGIALSARTEQLMAQKLDIDLRPGLDRRAGETIKAAASPLAGLFADKKKKRSGLWGSGADDDGSPVFVPWYRHVFTPQKFKGKPRWWVPFTYFIAGSVALLATYYIFRFWM